jgi:MFS family permease
MQHKTINSPGNNYLKNLLTGNTGAISLSKSIAIYCIVSLFLFFEMAVQVSPSVMSSQLMHDLNISAFGLGIMSGFYFYTYSAMQISSGFLLDRFNPRLIIGISILICSLGAIFFAYSTNIYLGSLARSLMGSGSAFAFVSVLVVTADLFPSKYFAALVGVTQMLAAFGAMAGQMPIGMLLTSIGWRATMLLIAFVGIVLAVIVLVMVKYPKKPTASKSILCTVKADLPKIMSNPQSWYIAFYSCLLWAPMSGFASLWGVPYLTSFDKLSHADAAWICSFMWLGLALASPFLGVVSTAVKNRIYPLSIAGLIGLISFGLILECEFSKMALAILLFLAGAACSGQALSFAVIKENNPDSIKATAIAFNNMAVVISGAIFQPLIGKFVVTHSANNVISYDPASFKYGLSILLLAYLMAFLIPLFLIKESKLHKLV